MWLSTIKQSMKALLKIVVNPLLKTILHSKCKDSNIFKGTLTPEASTYRKTKGMENFRRKMARKL